MRIRQRAITAALVTAFIVAACGDDADPGTTVDAGPDEGAQGSAIAAVGTDSELGRILVDANGMTIYGFTNDADGQSACDGTCAEAWPPLVVGADWSVGPELDSAIFNTHTRSDGTLQLVAGPWPLYTFSEDTVPGDVKGQGSGGVWYVVSADDGTLIRDEPDSGGGSAGAEEVQVGETDLGEVLTNADGLTLYGFTQDAEGVPTCVADCAGTWPPLLEDADPTLGEGLDPEVFTTVEGAEGGTQVVAGRWPLYTFAGDSDPGDVNGQGSGGVWFAVAPDGSLVDADGAVEPAPSDSGDSGESGSSGGGY